MNKPTWTEKEVVIWHQLEPGASAETLMRRAGYGGRKGRRAIRRLNVMPRTVARIGIAMMSEASPK